MQKMNDRSEESLCGSFSVPITDFLLDMVKSRRDYIALCVPMFHLGKKTKHVCLHVFKYKSWGSQVLPPWNPDKFVRPQDLGASLTMCLSKLQETYVPSQLYGEKHSDSLTSRGLIFFFPSNSSLSI